MTGDNGLGKSFLLDVAWWALTRRWPHEINETIPAGFKAVPRDPAKAASTSFSFEARTKLKEQKSAFERDSQVWKRTAGRPPNPDPARNDWKGDNADRPSAFGFSSSQVWNGLEAGSQTLCCRSHSARACFEIGPHGSEKMGRPSVCSSKCSRRSARKANSFRQEN